MQTYRQANRHCSGLCKVTEEDANQRTTEKKMWRKKCGQQVSGAA